MYLFHLYVCLFIGLFVLYFDNLGTPTGIYPENFVKIRFDLAEIYRIKKCLFCFFVCLFVYWLVCFSFILIILGHPQDYTLVPTGMVPLLDTVRQPLNAPPNRRYHRSMKNPQYLFSRLGETKRRYASLQSSLRWVGYSNSRLLPCSFERTLGSPSFARQEVLQACEPACALREVGPNTHCQGVQGCCLANSWPNRHPTGLK